MADKTNNEELLCRFLNGELSPQQESQALHMIADDDEMREMLRFEQRFHQGFGPEYNPDSFNVPEGFADNVMSQITTNEAVSPLHNLWDKINAFFAALLTPRRVTIRPAIAIMMILIMIGSMTLLLPDIGEQNPEMTTEAIETSTQQVADRGQQAWIRFVFFDDDATTVAVAGDFSDWDPISLTKETIGDKQVWTGLIPVSKQEQRYMFVKDGEQWVTDPLAEVQRDDGFGNKNAVLFL